MRHGFTTGSCAAAAAKAAAYMLFSGREKKEITILTPKNIPYRAEIVDIVRKNDAVSCAVKKDGGDDPDVTSGTYIYAKVSFLKDQKEAKDITHDIVIRGGKGVGRVTRPGLDQPVGNAAINHVPRQMIKNEVSEVCDLWDYKGDILVEISVPNGEEIAKQTFNQRLGIVGGISILGTSGIVEPMSTQAILDTIYLELKQRREEGCSHVIVSPGNYGIDFMKQTYGYDLEKSVKCSNFIGDTIDMAAELGFSHMLLVGHIGKLIKTAGGIMNTHSKEADCRMELLAAFAIKMHTPSEVVRQILECVTTEEAVKILQQNGKCKEVMDYAMERICFYLQKRGMGRIQVDCIVYANELGELAKSEEAEKWFTL